MAGTRSGSKVKAMKISLDSVGTYGVDLRRPECVLCTHNGDVFTSSADGGVTHIAVDGVQRTIGAASTVDGERWISNGLALRQDGSFLVGNIGAGGGLWRLERNGAVLPVLREVDHHPLLGVNFVLLDHLERVWLTVSAQCEPLWRAFSPATNPEVTNGLIVLLDRKGARIVADQHAFTNELRLSPSGQYLFVVETFARRITRYSVRADGSLYQRQAFVTFDRGVLPDGLAFDQDGYLWVASVISNQLLRVAPDGAYDVVLDDSVPTHVEEIERLMENDALRREHLGATPSRQLKNISSIAFGGSDLRTVYLGCIAGDRLSTFRSPVAGSPMTHWRY
jgi:hypothetical protein